MRSITLLVFLCAPILSAAAQDQLLTHSTDFARLPQSEWRAEPWRVNNPDPGATIVAVDGVLAFVVTEPDSAMAWTLTIEPVWTAPFATLAAAYFVEGGAPSDGGPPFELFDGSTGPITPGATNTENPLASGGRLACGSFAPGLHLETIDLAAVENLDRVAEITITVRSGDEPVVLRLNQLAFLADPAAESVDLPPWQPRSADGEVHTVLALPREGRVHTEALSQMLGLEAAWLRAGRVHFDELPYQLDGYGVATPLNAPGNITLDARGSGNTLAFLCAGRIWGSGEGWYAGSPPGRQQADGAGQFLATLQYEDGTVTQAIPQRTDKDRPGLWPSVGAYTVALDPGRTLVSVSLEEGMSFGQVVLLAASRLDRPDVAAVASPGEVAREPDTRDGALPEDVLILEGDSMRLALDRQGMVHSMQLGEGRHEIVEIPFPLLTLSDLEGNALPLSFVEVLRVPTRDRMVILWNVGKGGWQCELSLKLERDGGLACTATLGNLGDDGWDLAAVLPRLTGLNISRGGASAYVLGGRSAILDSAPVDMAAIYGGQYPNQFMDLYDGERGGGLACIVRDETLARKWFEFKLDEAGRAIMAVSYRRLHVAPGERLRLPTAALLPHEGDWRAPFQNYRAWVRRAFPRMRDNAMDDIFYCRRDYPLGGTSYLYDAGAPGYSFEKLISESRWAFGGVDMIDISGWAYNEAVGRVGTYRENDLGGLDALARGVWTSHNRKVKVGLYFEGYLLDRRARNAATSLAEWQLIREGGQPAWWPGDMEFFVCPGAPGWQETLARDIAAVAEKTRADAVYVDQLGIADVGKECWAAHHGHPVPSNPIATEIELLKRIRAELDTVRPACAIYIEHIPCDAMTPYIDGAFNLGMKHTRHPQGPTKLPLHRYLHPEVPVFEMVAHGIRPIPAEEDDLKLAFFHGMGLWLKGKGASWYSAGFREQAAALYPIYTKFGAHFRSPDAEPHVDTLQGGVYANRFPHGGDVLYTLYNANATTVTGPLLTLPEGDGQSITSLVEGATLTLDIAGGETVLTGSIPPHGVAGVVIVTAAN